MIFYEIKGLEERETIKSGTFPKSRVYPYYSSFDNLIVAYESFKSMPGFMTPGVY